MLGENHPDVANSYNNLADICNKLGENKIALDYYIKAYLIVTFHFKSSHPYTQNIYNNMKMAYLQWNPKGNFNQWLEEQMRDIRKSRFRVIKNETN